MSSILDKQERLINLQKANRIYFYSLQHQKIIRLLPNEIHSYQSCQLCTPTYYQKCRKGCKFSYNNLGDFITHVLDQEKRFKRQLVWSTVSEIPDDVEKYGREFGDLITFKDEEILKIVFSSKTIIVSRIHFVSYFKRNGCGCLDEKDKSCEVCVMGRQNVLDHLAGVERRSGKYVVFTVDSSDLQDEVDLNDVLRVQYHEDKISRPNNQVSNSDQEKNSNEQNPSDKLTLIRTRSTAYLQYKIPLFRLVHSLSAVLPLLKIGIDLKNKKLAKVKISTTPSMSSRPHSPENFFNKSISSTVQANVINNGRKVKCGFDPSINGSQSDLTIIRTFDGRTFRLQVNSLRRRRPGEQLSPRVIDSETDRLTDSISTTVIFCPVNPLPIRTIEIDQHNVTLKYPNDSTRSSSVSSLISTSNMMANQQSSTKQPAVTITCYSELNNQQSKSCNRVNSDTFKVTSLISLENGKREIEQSEEKQLKKKKEDNKPDIVIKSSIEESPESLHGSLITYSKLDMSTSSISSNISASSQNSSLESEDVIMLSDVISSDRKLDDENLIGTCVQIDDLIVVDETSKS